MTARKSRNLADGCWWHDGPIALVKNGDTITIDAENVALTLEISAHELKA